MGVPPTRRDVTSYLGDGRLLQRRSEALFTPNARVHSTCSQHAELSLNTLQDSLSCTLLQATGSLVGVSSIHYSRIETTLLFVTFGNVVICND